MEGSSLLPIDEGSSKRTKFKKTSRGPKGKCIAAIECSPISTTEPSITRQESASLLKGVYVDDIPSQEVPVEEVKFSEIPITEGKSVACRAETCDVKRKSIVRKGKQASFSEESFTKFQSRMSPRGLSQLVKKIKDDQDKHQAVCDIGFGSLLDFDLMKLDDSLCMWLVQNFHPYSRTLRLGSGKELVITEEDIHCTLGIPMGSKEVIEACPDMNNEEYNKFLSSWRSSWGLSNSVPKTTVLGNSIMERGHGDQFKIDFVVYIVSSFLNGKQDAFCKSKILYSLMNVNEIKDYNWCSYTMKGLLDAVELWQANPKRYFKGCITFLMVSVIFTHSILF